MATFRHEDPAQIRELAEAFGGEVMMGAFVTEPAYQEEGGRASEAAGSVPDWREWRRAN